MDVTGWDARNWEYEDSTRVKTTRITDRVGWAQDDQTEEVKAGASPSVTSSGLSEHLSQPAFYG